MTDLIRDLRWAVRTLGKTPLFAAVAILTLALGIGVNATIFTLVNSLLLRPLPVERPEEMVHVYTSWPEEPFATSSYPDYLDLRDGTDAFAGELVGHASAIATLQHGGRSEVMIGEIVTGNAFQVLGVPAARGRTLLPEDDRPEASRVVVLSHGLWQRRFGRDPGVLGGTVRLNGQPYQVVGVAPESFPGLLPGVAAQYWVPTVRVGEIEPAGQINAVHGDPGATRLERRGYRWMWLKGRLAPGTDPAQADAQVATVMARLAAEHPVTNENRTAAAKPLADVRYHPDIDRVLGPAAAVLLGAVGLVLLVVCANLASMLLARAQGRRREVAIRLALGASRGRLVRQLLAESLVVAAAGGALALLVTRWTTALLLAWKPPIPFTLSFDLDVDGRVLLFTAAVALGSAVLFGLLPARQSARSDLVADIKEGARGNAGTAHGWRRRLDLRSALVVAQVAITLVFLVAAALLGRGLLAARALDPGFEPERVAVLGMYLEMHGYGDEEAERFFRTLRERAAALPGVTEAAVATRVPFDVNIHNTSIYPDSVEADPDHPGFALDVTWIDRQYFDTLGVPLLAGRGFTSGDLPDAPRVAVVNAAMARRFWGDPAAAVGRRFRVGGLDAEPTEVVGVAADTKVRSVGEEPRPMVHFARSQRPAPHGYLLAATAAGDATPLVGELRRLALEMDPELAFSETTTLAGFMGVTLYPARMGAALLAVFGLLALTLASLGLYGVIAYSVSRRRREMGIRFALGAERGTVVGMVVKSGMTLVAIGIAVGAALAAAAGQLLQSLLYGQSALDPAAFAAAIAVLLTVSAAANYLPARRAAQTDPVTVLKEG
jgi:predicted permease